MAQSILEKIFYILKFYDRAKLGNKKADREDASQIKRAEKENRHRHKIPQDVISDRFGRAINRLSDK